MLVPEGISQESWYIILLYTLYLGSAPILGMSWDVILNTLDVPRYTVHFVMYEKNES